MGVNVTIYTDGSALGNPGRGGYGIVMLSGTFRKEISDGYRLTTNNRMELLAVIVAIESMKKMGCNLTIYSDSSYVVNAIEKRWVWGWQKVNFKDKKNADLWQRFLKVYPTQNIKMVWVKGHADIPENERCDILAKNAAAAPALKADSWYEANGNPDRAGLGL